MWDERRSRYAPRRGADGVGWFRFGGQEDASMQLKAQTHPVSRKRLWAGQVITVFAVLFLLFDSIIKFTKADIVAQSFGQLGYPVSLAATIGILELICIAVYL